MRGCTLQYSTRVNAARSLLAWSSDIASLVVRLLTRTVISTRRYKCNIGIRGTQDFARDYARITPGLLPDCSGLLPGFIAQEGAACDRLCAVPASLLREIYRR